MRKAGMIDIRDILRRRHEPGLTRNAGAAALGVSAARYPTCRNGQRRPGCRAGRFRTGLMRMRCGTGSTRRPNAGANMCSPAGMTSSPITGLPAAGSAPFRRNNCRESARIRRCASTMHRGIAACRHRRQDAARSHRHRRDRRRDRRRRAAAFESRPRRGDAEPENLPPGEACRRAMECFGGTPAIRSIDNLESGVVRADREDPVFNPAFRGFARHHGPGSRRTRVRRKRR